MKLIVRQHDNRYEKWIIYLKRRVPIVIKEIDDYVKNGSNGNLIIEEAYLEELPINLTKINGNLILENLPLIKLNENMVINGNLFCCHIPLANIYTEEEIKQMCTINGDIYKWFY